jgi:RNA polymerase sigma factor (TIGR02999 family)
VDHAKGRQRTKRGGELSIVSLAPGNEGSQGAASAGEIDVLEIDEALGRLSERDPRLAQIVELHYFAGMTYQETALALGVSEATVHRDLRMAKAWILAQIRSSETSP